VSFLGGDDTNTTLVGTASGHSTITDVKLDETSHFASGNVKFDGILRLGQRVGVTDSAAVVGDEVRDGTGLTVVEGIAADGSLGAVAEVFDAAQFEFGLFGVLDLVKNEAALGIVEETEFLGGLVNGDNVHETGRVVEVCANFAVNFNQASLANGHGLFAGQSILKTVFQDKAHGQALSQFVRTGRGARGPAATKLGKHPMLGSIQTLQMSFLSTSHVSSIK
jgi:hypothetical protein